MDSCEECKYYFEDEDGTSCCNYYGTDLPKGIAHYVVETKDDFICTPADYEGLKSLQKYAYDNKANFKIDYVE